MFSLEDFLEEHRRLTRRYFLRASAAGAVAVTSWPLVGRAGEFPTELEPALADLESYLTLQDEFRDVSRGKPIPHTLPDDKKAEVGLTRETWQLEVRADPENKADIRNPLTREDGTAFQWKDLMQLAERHSVRFPKVMTCNNIGCPLGMGIWEGVPLRKVFWLAKPRRNIRRIYYYGFHNNDPKQMFRSSLPIGRVLEDPFGLPPVILCYKLNGQWLTSERGGPVRIVVPEAYGFKSVKWITNLVVTNLFHANDTYAEQNNDIDSWLKTFAATLSLPERARAGEPIPVTGYAQVGISGLSKVQVWISRDDAKTVTGDKYFAKAPWVDAKILPVPKEWGGGLPEGTIPADTFGFDSDTRLPNSWPMRLAKAHWAKLLPGLPPGEYTFRCRSIDGNGNAQPMPRPFDKSGRNSIEQMPLVVEA